MPSIQQLTSADRVVVPYGPASVAIIYDEDKFTAKVQQRVQAAKVRYEATNDDDETLVADLKAQLAAILCSVATGWDVDEGDDAHTPTPFDMPHLTACALRFLSAALSAIADAIAAKNPTGKMSDSSPTP